MTLARGTFLGSFEILEPLGAGGMGEVYKARDTRLDRTVAIKVLPAALAGDPQFRERFDREARVISQLTHPNICTLYDVGEAPGPDSSGSGPFRFLVMEFLEGETLADRLANASQTGLPLDEALQIAMQVADALDKAHRAGVVHRDLKPGNIMLARRGARSIGGPHAKLLDFGLAKTGAASPAAGLTMLPTTPPNLTAQGTILGTFHYMAPEQLEGGDADARTDIFAFGLIVHEMLTGRKVFEGKSQAALIAAVLEHPVPPMSSAQRPVPAALEEVVRGCLAKDPEDRWQSARDVLRQLKGVSASAPADEPARSPTAAAASVPAKSPARRWPWAAAAMLVGAALASGVWWLATRSPARRLAPMHVSIALPGAAISTVLSAPEISPNGEWIVHTVVRGERQLLSLRPTEQPTGKLVDGTEGAVHPFFSPDSQWMAFAVGNTLMKVPVSGGSPTAICTLSSTSDFSTAFVGGSWGADDTIVFIPQFNGGIWTVPAAGGTPRLLLKTDESKDRIAYLYPRMLPASRGVVFTLIPNRARASEEVDIAVLESGATEPRTVIHGGADARYLSTGHLVYARADTLLAVPFDLTRLDVAGTPAPVLHGLQRSQLGDVFYTVSNAGTLVYQPFSGSNYEALLAVFDRRGVARAIPDTRGQNIAEFSVSPDGGTVSTRVLATNDDVWTYGVDRGSPLRLTFEPGDEISPQWTPDGTKIAFGTRTGRIFLKPSDGTGQRVEIASGEFQRMPTSFSPDGKTLAFTEIHPTRKRDILLLPLDGERKPQPFAATDADERDAKFSPDGRWIAYVSNETGRDDIFVRPIGGAGGRRRVTAGGTAPAWARTSRELFFLKGDKLTSVGLDAGGNPLGAERTVLDAPKLNEFAFHEDAPYYAVLPDGDRFVMLLSKTYPPPTYYNLVINWFEEITRLVPNGK